MQQHGNLKVLGKLSTDTLFEIKGVQITRQEAIMLKVLTNGEYVEYKVQVEDYGDYLYRDQQEALSVAERVAYNKEKDVTVTKISYMIESSRAHKIILDTCKIKIATFEAPAPYIPETTCCYELRIEDKNATVMHTEDKDSDYTHEQVVEILKDLVEETDGPTGYFGCSAKRYTVYKTTQQSYRENGNIKHKVISEEHLRTISYDVWKESDNWCDKSE